MRSASFRSFAAVGFLLSGSVVGSCTLTGPLDGYTGGEKPDASADVGSDVFVACGTPGYYDCDNDLTNGCETHIAADPNNCGTCWNVCTVGDPPTCSNGMCSSGECAGGTADCDQNPENGCETDIASQVNSCGSCTAKCELAHATPKCEFGQCKIAVCATGWDNCDKTESTGCEIDITTSVQHCGGCSKGCTGGDNAKAVCTAGDCALQCNAGFSDCDKVPTNGCEANLNTDIAHCGTCTTSCSTTGGTATCATGVCKITCTAPNADCNKDVTDGCEVDLNSDPFHCGQCPTVCPVYPSAVGTCTNGTCGWSCVAGSGDCDNQTSTGCETSVVSDAKNCGVCGHDCIDSACQGGLCQPIVLAGSLNRPAAVVVDNLRVFWTDVYGNGTSGTLLVKNKAGGAVTELADFGASEELAISSDGVSVLWYTLVNIAKVPAAGGSVSVVTAQQNVKGLAVDTDTVYFLREGTWSGTYNKDGSVSRISINGGTVTPLATDQDWPMAVAVDANNVYWVNQGTAPDLGKVMRMPKGGGTPAEVASGQIMPCGIAVNASAVFWMTHCDATTPGKRALMKAPKSGGSAAPLIEGVDGSENLAADDNFVYWTFSGFAADSGTVVKLPVGGAPAVTVLASKQNHPRGMVVDALRVYWANTGSGTDQSPSGDGSIMTVAK